MEVIKIKNCDTLVIKKRPDSKYYHCSFYSGKSTTNKSGMTRVSLRTANQKEAVKQQPVMVKRKPGRNERVKVLNLQSGETKEMKFKQAEPLINAGSWQLVESN